MVSCNPSHLRLARGTGRLVRCRVKHDQQVFLYGKYCGGLKILIFNWAGLQILPNGKGIFHADCKSLYSIGQDCKSCPTAKESLMRIANPYTQLGRIANPAQQQRMSRCWVAHGLPLWRICNLPQLSRGICNSPSPQQLDEVASYKLTAGRGRA